MKLKSLFLKSIGLAFNFIGLFSHYLALKLAIDLFSKPRKGRLLHYHEKYLNSFTQEDILVRNVNIRIYIKGTGQTKILLVHGWESNSWRWRKLLQYLDSDLYSFILMDAPAHGKSDSQKFDLDLFAEAIYKAGELFQPNYIVGHSIGDLQP
jgi:alpha-beta hydrolase superfamily lysophospholipase